MDVDTFFDPIRKNLIGLMNRILADLGSARVQMTAWIRFKQALEDDLGNVIGYDMERLLFNSRMTDIFQGSDFNEMVGEMLADMKMQFESPALANSRFVFDEVLFLDVSFYQLRLTRSSSYLLVPDYIEKKKAIINPQNGDEECLNGLLLQHRK